MTKQVQIEQSVANNIINAINHPLIKIDETYTIKTFNDCALKRTGMRSEQLQNANALSVFPVLSKLIDELERLVESQESHLFNQVKDDSGNYFDVHVYPVEEDDGKQLVVEIEEITDDVEYQQQIAEQAAFFSHGGMASIYSHELVDILEELKQTTQAMQVLWKNDELDRPAVDENINKTELLSTRAMQLVDRMMRFNALTEQSSSLIILPDIINKTLNQVSDYYQMSENFDVDDIQISTNIAKKIPAIQGIALEIEQVLMNFLKLSISRVRQNTEDEPYICISLTKTDYFVVLGIADNGPELEQHFIDMLDKPFEGIKDLIDSHVLEFVVSKHFIVDNHNGNLEITSQRHRGTQVTITLPLNN